MKLRDIAPSLRCITYGDGQTWVEIPRHWRDRVRDERVVQAITALILEDGKTGDIYAEGVAEAFEDHRLRMAGYLVPVEAWDRVMSQELD